MNLFGKMGTKKLSKRLLAVMLAVVLVATQFLTTAVWSFADTSSPEGTQYNVVLDADLLTADDSFAPSNAVTLVDTKAFSGNAYAWNMAAAGDAVLSFPATGYSDEVALVIWMDTTAFAADADIAITLNSDSDSYAIDGDADDNGLLYTFPEEDPIEGIGFPAVSDAGVVTIPADFVGWLMIPFDGFADSIPSGEIVSVGLSTTAQDALYMDEIGFVSVDWSENFYVQLTEGTLTANRRDRCEVYDHDWEDATCTTPKTCKYCSTPEGLANGHTWDIDDCAQDRVCLICGTPEAAKSHSYVSDGDCFTADACDSCSMVQPDSELGHHFADATCTAPKTCSDCGATEGNALGHNWKLGVCETCEVAVYDIAENFDDADVTLIQAGGSYELVSGDAYPFGQALKFGRGSSKADILINFDAAGTADHKAIVFYYDNTGYTGHAAFSFVPTTSEGNQMCLGTGYTYYTVINGQVEEAHPSDNFTLKLPQQTAGWVILPLPGAPGTVWHKGGSGAFYGTTRDIAKMYLEFVYFNNASVVVDQFGFANDVELFKSLAAAGNLNLPGYTGDAVICEDGAHAWTDATCISPKKCEICGLADGLPNLNGHVYSIAATCGTPGYCSVCGSEDPDAPATGAHDMEPATCGADEYCRVCGAEGANKATGQHNLQPATCVAQEYCTVCKTTFGSLPGGHVWGADGKCETCGNEPAFTVGENFTGAADGGNYKVADCISKFGDGVKLTYSASGAFSNLPFTTVGGAYDKALAFWYDATANSGDVKIQIIPRYEGGCGVTIKGVYRDASTAVTSVGHPVTTIIDGVVTEGDTMFFTENMMFSVKGGTSGWIIIPLDNALYGQGAIGEGKTQWSYGGGDNAYSGTAKGIASVDVKVTTVNGSVILDQFGYVEDVNHFANKAASGNDNLADYAAPTSHDWQDANCANPKTCKDCGITEGERSGSHAWVNGACSVCGQEIYTIAENFDSAVLSGTEGAWQLVTGGNYPFGQALWFGRDTSSTNVNITLDAAGAADQKAIVFYYDNTGSENGDERVYFYLRPYTSQGVGITLSTSYTYYTVVNGVMKAAQPSHNFGLRLPANSKGWVILPLPAAGTWAFNNVPGAPYYGTTQDIANIYLEFYEYDKASVVVDQFGFTKDVETFAAAAIDGNKYIPGYVDICGGNHQWVPASCGVDEHCENCGMIGENKATGDHRWIDPTCSEAGYCKECLQINPEAPATGQHSMKPATCGTPATCRVCGHTEGTPTGNHTPNIEHANCGVASVCTVCSTLLEAATGAHNWEEASCATPKTCKVCKQTEGSAPGHLWGDDMVCDTCGAEKTIYNIAQDFEAAEPNVSNAVDAIVELVDGKTDFGQALKFGRTTEPASLRIHFDQIGLPTDKALVFWYDVTGSGFNGDASMSFIPRDANGYGITLGTSYTYYTVINGKVSTNYPTGNFTLKLPKNSKGWIVMPLTAETTGTWGYGGGEGGGYTGTCDRLAAVDVAFPSFHHASVVLDQFGFIEDVTTFTDAASFGNLNLNGYTGAPSSCTEHTWSVPNCGSPKHCIECGLVDGVRDGEHDWEDANCIAPKTCKICFSTEGEALGHNFVDNFCTNCGMEVGDYEVVMDFDGRDPINISNKGCTYVVAGTGYKGNAMILDRGATAGLNSSQVRFNPTGKADEEALVFFMDASNNTNVGTITLYVYDNGTSRCLKPTAGSKIYAIDVKGNKKEIIIPDNNGVPFELGFEGWYVIPFDSITHDHWKTKIDAATGAIVGDIVYGHLDSGKVNELFLGYGGNPGSLFEMDNFGFTTDMDKFIAEAVAGTVNSDVYGETEVESNIGKPLPGLGGGDEEYVPDLSNPSPSDYNVIVDFDDKMFVNLVDHESQPGNAGYSRVASANLNKPNFSGCSLWWNRGTDGTVTRVEMDVTPTGYSDENAFLFWIDTKDMVGSGHPITLLLYGENADDGSEVCMRLNNGGVYRLVSTKTKKVTDRVCAADGSLFIPSGFEGFVVVPYAAMESHWGGMGIKLKPGTIHRLWMYHGYTYGEELYIDNIGATHNIQNFTDKVIAGTLNAVNERVDVGEHILPLPEGAGVSDTNLSGGADGKTADNDFFHTVANFNSKVPTVGESNSYIKLMKESPSGYGSGLNWFKMDDTLATEITLSTDGGQEGDQGIALWISTKDSGNTFNTSIRFMPHDFVTVDSGVKERCWRLIDNASYYLVQGETATEQMVSISQMVTIPGGFEGWLVVPYSSLEIHWGTPEGQDPKEQKVDPTQMKKLNLYYGNPAVTEYIHVDEYGFFTNARRFIESIGAAFPKPPMNGAVIQSLDRTFGEGGIGNSAAIGSLAWSDKATLELNGDISNDSYSLVIDATAGTQVHFPIDIATSEEDIYGIQAEDIVKLKDFTGLGFWINTEKAIDLSVSVLQNNGKTYVINSTGKVSDIYRLVDETAVTTTAYQFGQDDTIHVPAGFVGWVVVDTAVFQSGVDLSLLKEVIVTFKSDATAYIDTVRTATSAVGLITREISYPMDTDLLVSTDESLITITTDEDGNKIITLAENMDSTRFREIVDIRGGYREIFDDENGAQMFGKIDLMSDVAGIKVYIADSMMAYYEVSVVGFEKDENGFDIDGDGVIDGIGVDIDGDGVFDGVGADFNGDGVFDGVWMDIDGDGIVDGVDLDQGYGFDGILDGIDLNGDWRADGIDLDGDGVIDGMGIDIDLDGSGIYEGVLEGIDVDGDGIWDGVDIDYDGVVDYYDIDGNAICDGIGIDMGGDGTINFVISGVDFDGDGLFDGIDIDLDGYSDGIALDLDADGNYDGVGVDLTGDGYVDAMAIDVDGDGLFDGVDVNFDGVIDFEVIDGDLGNIPGLTFPDNEGNFSPDTGETNLLWVYILGAAMLVVVIALGVYNRKAKNK